MGMNEPRERDKPADQRTETVAERARRLEQRKVGPEDEDRKSPGGPGSQIAPDVEPSGS
jgi:hypothetical protein